MLCDTRIRRDRILAKTGGQKGVKNMTSRRTGAFEGLSYAFNSNGLLAHRTEAILDLLPPMGIRAWPSLWITVT
jgi:hypothetical protein